jgi:phosphoglycolate phosphatase
VIDAEDATGGYEAVVYDLDGTLVSLAVDWDAVRADVAAVYESAGVDPDGRSLWTLLETAPAHDLLDDVDDAIAEHERAGARDSTRLPHADDVHARTVPVGICSLNCEAACRIALDRHDLLEGVGAIVGRDTVATRKPDPEPLLATVRELAAMPERTLFVGDSSRDERTAVRAGTAFEYVDGGPSGH